MFRNFRSDHCYIIAEIGGNFTTYEQAVRLVDAAADCGVDAIKLQTYRAETVASKKALFDMENTGKVSQFELFQKYAIDKELHRQVFAYAEEKGLDWFSSPSHESDVDMLETLGVGVHKIGSDDAVNLPFLRYVARMGKPIILSTGMCTLEEVRESVSAILGEGGLAFSADGKWLVAACGREIKAWKTLPGSLVEYKVNLPEIIPTAELQAFYDWISKEYKAGLPSTLMSNFYKISFSTDQNWLSSGGRAWRMDMFPNSMPQSKEWSRWRLECKKQIIIWVGQDESPCDGKGYFSNITYAVSPLGQWWAWSSSYFKYYQDFSVWVRNNQKEFRLEGHQGPVRQLVFTPDKRWLVSASGTVKDWQGDGTIRFWDLASPDPNTNPLIYYTGSENPLLSLSPDGKWLVVVSENQVIRLLDIQTMNFTQDPIRFKQISNLFLSPDNQWIFGTDGQGMQLLDLSAQNPTMATTSLGLYSSALFGKSGKWVILSNSQHDDSQIRSLSNQKNFDLPVSLYRFWFSNDDHWLVGSSSDLFYLYNISTLDTSPAEAFIASNSYSNDKQVTAFAWESIWHQAARVFFDSTNHWLITSVGKDTRLVNLFSTKQPYESFMLQNISALAISPNGKQLATLDFVTSQATILDLEKMEPMQLVFPKTTLQQVLFEGDRPVSAEFSPNGEWLFISTCESVLVSDDKTPRDSRQPGCVQAGKASIYLWNPILADPMKSAVHIPGIGSFTIEFSSNNRWLRAKDSTGKVTLLDLSKTQPGSIELTASSNLFDPASRWFASTGTSGGIILYDLTSPNMRVISVTTPGYQLASLAFSPDGAWLAAGTSTGKVLLWNMREDGPESVFYVLDGGSKTYNQLFFSKDGRWLLAGGPEEEFVSWHMETNTLLEMACTSAGRNLTRAEWTQYGFTENYRATCPQWPIEPEPTSTPTP